MAQPRLKFDENIARDAVDLARSRGFDVATVADEQLTGQPDAVIAGVCMREGRVLVTLDLDFADVRAYPPIVAESSRTYRMGGRVTPLTQTPASLRTQRPLERDGR